MRAAFCQLSHGRFSREVVLFRHGLEEHLPVLVAAFVHVKHLFVSVRLVSVR